MATDAAALGTRSTADRNAGDIASLAGRVADQLALTPVGLVEDCRSGGTIGYIGSVGLPLAPLGLAIAVGIEIGGGLALVLGYRARIAAALVAVFSIAAALGFHRNFADLNQFVHFMKNVAIAGGLLQIGAFGAGRFSLDAQDRARKWPLVQFRSIRLAERSTFVLQLGQNRICGTARLARFFFAIFPRVGRCGHMSGLFRGFLPLATMRSAKQIA